MREVAKPVPIAVRLPAGITLRGHEWSVDGPAVVFVHDLGGDLDDWGPVTTRVAAKGFRVISLELRGHGLSEGEPSPQSLLDDLLMLLGEVSGSFGPVAVVSYGVLAETLLFTDSDAGAPVQVMISPASVSPEGPDWRGTRSAMRLVLNGSLDKKGHAYLDQIYPKILGQKLRISAASPAKGPQLLLDQPQLLEHMTIFLRRNLTPYHLWWISQHTDQIAAARTESSRPNPGQVEDEEQS